MKWCASLRFANLVLSLLHYENDFVLELLSSRHDEKCTTIQNIAACSDVSINGPFRNRANSLITDKFLEISRKDIREMYLWNWLESIGYFATGSNDIELVSSHFVYFISIRNAAKVINDVHTEFFFFCVKQVHRLYLERNIHPLQYTQHHQQQQF